MASKRRIRRNEKRRACDGKVRHEKREQAIAAKFKGGSDYRGTWAYLCKFCKGWHLGHPKLKWKQAAHAWAK